MQKLNNDFVQFEKLHILNYGIFQGSHDFIFDQGQTFIIGGNGTGKTTIVNAIEEYFSHDNKPDIVDFKVELYLSGNEELIEKYLKLVFLGCDTAIDLVENYDELFIDIIDIKLKHKIDEEVKNIYHIFIPWDDRSLQDNISFSGMAMGNIVCSSYAIALACRKVLNINLPMIFDSPYGALDLIVRNNVKVYLHQQPYQQIFIGNESNFTEEDKIDYTL